ncbi:MAG: hypothetical protein ACRDD7_08485 [Peptostreptococcaceae bacterium]
MKIVNENMYTTEERANNGFTVKFKDKNKKGESLLIDFTYCQNDVSYSRSLPNLWFKNGYIDRILETYWCIDVEIKDTEGRSWRKYEPTSKLSEDKKRMVINFEWMLEATEENKQKLIDEVYRLFMSATGKSATEEKIDKVKEYAKKNDLEVVTEVPEGWIKKNYASDPCGSISVCNTNWTLKAIKDGTFKRKLLLV